MAEPTRAEQLHDEYRNQVWDDIRSGCENFDKYMLTLSSGALGLSLAFIKDVVPVGKIVYVPSLISSWIAFVLCILITLVSFRISIHELEKMGPYLDAFYLEGKTDAFNKHLERFWTKAIDWCANLAIIFFVLGLISTMIFVGTNIREAKRVSEHETTTKPLPTSDCQKGMKPMAMTPLSEGVKPVAMTPFSDGLKPAIMTPLPPAQAPQTTPPAQSTPAPANSIFQGIN